MPTSSSDVNICILGKKGPVKLALLYVTTLLIDNETISIAISPGIEGGVAVVEEDVPELVATKNRKGMSAMDVVAVLTKVVQEN